MNLATLADRNLEEFGEYERLVFDEARLTNRELHDSSSRLARALVDLGLEPGERVVVIMPNCPEVLVSYPAIWRAGLAVIPVLFLLESRELRFILENSGASAVITSPDQLAKVQEAAEGTAVRHIVLVGEAVEGTQCFDELCRAHEPLVEAVHRAPSDLAVLLYTSGTTGMPKDVEEVIHQLEGVVECAVVGVPHERLGEEVMAYVVSSADADLTERSIVDHCQTQLAKYKTPRHVVLLAALPKNNIGKIMKRELRDRATRDAAQHTGSQG